MTADPAQLAVVSRAAVWLWLRSSSSQVELVTAPPSRYRQTGPVLLPPTNVMSALLSSSIINSRHSPHNDQCNQD